MTNELSPEELKTIRLNLALSQGALAEALGLPRNTIARWERGELTVRHPTLLRLALSTLARNRRTRPAREQQATPPAPGPSSA